MPCTDGGRRSGNPSTSVHISRASALRSAARYGCSVVAATAPEVGDFVFVVGSGEMNPGTRITRPGARVAGVKVAAMAVWVASASSYVLAKLVDSLYEASGNPNRGWQRGGYAL